MPEEKSLIKLTLGICISLDGVSGQSRMDPGRNFVSP